MHVANLQIHYALFSEFIQEVEFGQRHGFSASNDVEKETSWSFGSSYLFSVSVATTVG